MAAALTFLRVNGKIVIRYTEEPHTAMISIVKRQIGKPELAALILRLDS